MKNKSIGFVSVLAAITVMSSGLTVFATETESVANVEVSTDIITEVINDSTTKTATLDVPSLDIPVLAVAVAADENTQMEAQVILGDGSFTSSNRTTVEEKGDYTFLVSGLDMGKNDFLNFVLTFDFEGSQIKGSDIEDFSIDITELKIGEVSFNVEGTTLDKSTYDEGFRLFDIIKEDEEAYTKAFSTDGDSSSTELRVNSLSVSIHVTTLKLKKEEPPVTTTAPPATTSTTITTTVTTEASTTAKPADPATTAAPPATTSTTITTAVTTEVSTTSKPADPATTAVPNTTKATTTAKPTTTAVTTTKASDGTTPPPTGDAGVGVAVALLATSASIAIAARKRNK